MKKKWSLILKKENFRFSCAHFLIFPNGEKEKLHGHNYKVVCEFTGQYHEEEGLVLDFGCIKPIVRSLCDELNEHWLVPSMHNDLHIQHLEDNHTEVRYKDCKYLAPTNEIIVMPFNNTSVENLAEWFIDKLIEDITQKYPDTLSTIKVEIYENDGQAACIEKQI